MRVVYSGVQASGRLHLGNYLGATQRWAQLQTRDGAAPGRTATVYAIADLHSLTGRPGAAPDAPPLARVALECARAVLACGVDPRRCVLYRQSDVLEHANLAWLLGCLTPVAWLQRMVHYKDKARLHSAHDTAGLFTYPVLQAADMLLFGATHVPVGEDQRQHLELARDVALALNRHCGRDVVTPPQAVLAAGSARVM